jgi:hypothetical protein
MQSKIYLQEERRKEEEKEKKEINELNPGWQYFSLPA